MTASQKLGLAERTSDPHDRRVKLVLHTARGERTRTELMRDLETLYRVLVGVSPGAPKRG